MEINMLSIGDRIKTRRLELGLTQVDIYEKCGITSGVLSRIENGKNVPSILIFYKLSQSLECSTDWLITGISANMQNLELSSTEQVLLTGFHQICQDDQQELLDILEIKLKKRRSSSSGANRDAG